MTPITGKQLASLLYRPLEYKNNPHNGETTVSGRPFARVLGITPITGKQLNQLIKSVKDCENNPNNGETTKS